MNHNEVFFQTLFEGAPSEEYIEFRNITKDVKVSSRFHKVGDVLGHNDTVRKLIKGTEDSNLFFSLTTRISNKSGKKENCGYATSFWTDVDYGSVGHKKKPTFRNKEDALTFILNSPIKPSIIVDSGHGFHLYFLLEAPIQLTPSNISFIESANAKLAQIFGGDAVKDVSRVFRVPGSNNNKELIQKCDVISLDKNLRYNEVTFAAQIESIPSVNLPEELRAILFGQFEEGSDRSVLDQKLIHAFTKANLTFEEIKMIFDYYPTTGKYLERCLKDPNGAAAYLKHSYTKAKGHVVNTQKRQTNRNDFSEVADDSELDELDSTEVIQPQYVEIKENNRVGYSLDRINLLTNFIIEFYCSVYTQLRNNITRTFEGKILFAGKEVPLIMLTADILSKPAEFKKYLYNLCGTELEINLEMLKLVKAVFQNNSKVPTLVSKALGFSEDLKSYYTNELTITANQFLVERNPILNENDIVEYKVGFKLIDQKEFQDVRKKIVEIFSRDFILMLSFVHI